MRDRAGAGTAAGRGRGVGGAGRRLAFAVTTAGVIASLVLGIAAPSDAATKQATSLNLTAITHVATAVHPGATVISGDKVTLRGTASKSLVGKTLKVELKKGKKWIPYTGSGKVSAEKTFAITTRVTGVGEQTYRVAFKATAKLKAATAKRTTTVWKWYPLVDQDRVQVTESFGGNAPHKVAQLNVAGTSYAPLLAGTEYGQKTASSEYNLGYHCDRFTTRVGLGDNSGSGGVGTFTVYFDGDQADRKSVALGSTSTFDLDASGFFRVKLENSNTTAKYGDQASTAWPEAAVLCSAAP